MDKASPFVDAHTHKIQTDGNIWIVNILLKENSEEVRLNMPSALSVKVNLEPGIYFSVGIHPWYIDNWESKIKELEELSSNPKVVAIGECGLDKKHESSLDAQEQAFLFQILLSENLKKPLVIHCVKAFNELIQTRKSTKAQMPWVIHGFNNSLEIARQCIEYGMVVSFGKSLLSKNSKSVDVVKSLANNKFLLETDESNLPIEEIYTKCAGIKGISLEQLKIDMFQNVNHYFNL